MTPPPDSTPEQLAGPGSMEPLASALAPQPPAGGITSDTLAQARQIVAGHLSPTPLVHLRLRGIDRPVYVKLESFQPTGSFKVRGALAACAAYGKSNPANEQRIVTASAGNHGLGIAYAATRLGIPATVVVPKTASPAKVAALGSFDIDLRQIGADYDAAESAALEIAQETGRFVSPYNDPVVVAGQATIAYELLEQLNEPAIVVAPVGGGGLAAGLSLALAQHTDWRVIGVETEASRACSAAIEHGEIVTVPIGPTIADGLAGNLEPGSITPGIVAAAGTRVCAAAESEIRSAVRELATEHGLVVEGSGAVGLAALRAGLIDGDGPVVLLLTGRNIAAGLLAELLTQP